MSLDEMLKYYDIAKSEQAVHNRELRRVAQMKLRDSLKNKNRLGRELLAKQQLGAVPIANDTLRSDQVEAV